LDAILRDSGLCRVRRVWLFSDQRPFWSWSRDTAELAHCSCCPHQRRRQGLRRRDLESSPTTWQARIDALLIAFSRRNRRDVGRVRRGL